MVSVVVLIGGHHGLMGVFVGHCSRGMWYSRGRGMGEGEVDEVGEDGSVGEEGVGEKEDGRRMDGWRTKGQRRKKKRKKNRNRLLRYLRESDD